MRGLSIPSPAKGRAIDGFGRRDYVCVVATADAGRIYLSATADAGSRAKSDRAFGLAFAVDVPMTKFSDDIDCKAAALQGFKFAVNDAGVVSGYGSIFGNIDSHGERVVKGAYTNSLARHRASGSLPLMLWMHRPGEPIGSWKAVSEDDTGLMMTGQFNLNTSRGRDAYEHAKAGDVSGLSVGYREIKTKNNGGVLDLIELDLIETSVVSLPANPRARITGVKCESRADIERLLREGGLPRAAAVKVANGGWPALASEDEPDPSIDKLLSAVKAARLELKGITK